MASLLTDLERDREKRIAENRRRMAEMLGDVEQDFSLLTAQTQRPKPKATPRKPAPKERVIIADEDKRRSHRIRQLPAPAYNLDAADPTLREKAAGAGRAPKRTGSRALASIVFGARGGWCVQMGDCSLAAADAAIEAAKARVAALRAEGKVASFKLMSGSQVAGGFWMQLPNDFVANFRHREKINLELVSDAAPVMDDGSRPGFRYNKDDGRPNVWYAVWLPRPGQGESAGLSGGWRGFAIDQILFPNDTVVFERVSETVIRVHVFRGADYETEDTAAGGIRAVIPSLRGIRRTGAALAPAGGSSSGSGSASAASGGADGAAGGDGDVSAASGGDAWGGGDCGADSGYASQSDDLAPRGGADQDPRERAAASPSEGKKRARPSAAAADAARELDVGAGKRAKRGGGAAKKGKGAGGGGAAKGGRLEDDAAPARAAAAQGGFAGATPAQQAEADRAWAAGEEVCAPRPDPLPEKTASELRREQTAKQFWVKEILGYRLVGKTRQFLIRWWFFSAAWDTWEPRAMLDGAPATYEWAVPMPSAVKRMK
ncbi:hypothetical protein Rsub_10855 [Raphidocelis subcapitata]|uniref:Chromo domain-containing protein n=1 Tax=Raphidocelis subcapitata TaxID=307507 RepID=A0A2V0PF06_9CHLO|nr:hypothetical protein Rsub_10855 [Raphidocelis subcapitata]|eukprot:GBF98109.1 hypothetical protein Rsub_10855 [Raphidocelis subcapitata]